MHCVLLTGVALLCLTLPHLACANIIQSRISNDILKPECRDRFFYIWGEKNYFRSRKWQLEALNYTGFADLMEGQRAAQCGYTFTNDLDWNLEIRISFLGCWVQNINDQRFNISVQFKVEDNGKSETYPVYMSCRPERPWDVREIVCEENYMEVSVRKIPDALMKFLLPFLEPVAETEMYQVWQVLFFDHSSANGIISAEEAINKGYGVNATLSRVVVRAPYDMPESQVVQDGEYNLDVIYSKMQYTQTLLLLTIDTTMACPKDSPVFSERSLSWLSPLELRPLSVDFVNNQFAMGINGRLLSADVIQANNYLFQYSSNVVNVTIPYGASGGYAESDIVNNTYVTTFRINLVLQRRWLSKKKDDSTTHTQYKPVRSSAIKQIPIFKDYTMKKDRYFNVSLGNFYSDVNLKSFVIHSAPMALDVLVQRQMSTSTLIHLNNTQVFFLTVPFSDPLVEQTYLGGTSRRYTLYVTYVLTLVPKQKVFTYTDEVECVLEDVVPPEYTSSCGTDKFLLDMKRGNLDIHWLPYIQDIPLTSELINAQHFVVKNTDPFHLEVPYPSIGLVYEEASLSGFRVRMDFSLRDNKTLKIESRHSVTCFFPPKTVCSSNGYMIAVVDSSLTKPRIDIQKTHLRDPTCKPQQNKNTMALFNFTVYTCGTTYKFDSDYITYENEVTYDRAVLLPDQPIISRDSTYRLTVRCRYPIKASLKLGALYKNLNAMAGLAMPTQARVLRRRVRTHMAELKIAKDDSYASFYHAGDFPVSVKQGEDLYIQADVPSTILVSLLQNCWATTLPSHDGQPRWDLVLDGCPTTGGTAAISKDHSARLSVKLDEDINGQVYIHCQVLLCDPKLALNCYQTCNQTSERILGKRETSLLSEVVSAGPVKVISNDIEVGFQHLTGGKSWSTLSWVLPIGLGVIAVLTVCAIFLAVRLFLH